MLPKFNAAGDLPPGVYKASLEEVVARFGSEAGQRALCTERLARIISLARQTGHLRACVLFGSYVTQKPEPNDIDLVLVMDNAFRLDQCHPDLYTLFDHPLAQARHGASIFWIRPNLLIEDTLESFIEYWQIKRTGDKRGIVLIEEK